MKYSNEIDVLRRSKEKCLIMANKKRRNTIVMVKLRQPKRVKIPNGRTFSLDTLGKPKLIYLQMRL